MSSFSDHLSILLDSLHYAWISSVDTWISFLDSWTAVYQKHVDHASTVFVAWIHRILLICTVMMIVGMVLCGMFGVAVMQYAVGYWMFMPAIHVEKQVFFDYSMCVGDSPGPNATVNLVGNQWQSQNDIATANSLLYSNQLYHIKLDMNIADSELHNQIGVFQVQTELYSRDVLLAKSSRPVMLPYHSSYIATLKRYLLTFPVLLGIISEYHDLSVNLLENFLEVSSTPVTTIQFKISRPVLISRPSLSFYVQLHGLRYYAYYWFFSSMTLVVVLSMFFQFVLIVFISTFLYSKYSSSLEQSESDHYISHSRNIINSTSSPERRVSQVESSPIILAQVSPLHSSAFQKVMKSENNEDPKICKLNENSMPSTLNESESDTGLRKRKTQNNDIEINTII